VSSPTVEAPEIVCSPIFRTEVSGAKTPTIGTFAVPVMPIFAPAVIEETFPEALSAKRIHINLFASDLLVKGGTLIP
jgi:hypothetical protein